MDILNAQALDGGRLKIVEGVQVFRACVVDQVTKASESRVVRAAGGQRCGPIGPLGREHARVHRGVVPHKVKRGLVPDMARQALRHSRQLKPLRGFRRGLIERLPLHPSGVGQLHAAPNGLAETAQGRRNRRPDDQPHKQCGERVVPARWPQTGEASCEREQQRHQRQIAGMPRQAAQHPRRRWKAQDQPGQQQQAGCPPPAPPPADRAEPI